MLLKETKYTNHAQNIWTVSTFTIEIKLVPLNVKKLSKFHSPTKCNRKIASPFSMHL
jgi:hypothetical protein